MIDTKKDYIFNMQFSSNEHKRKGVVDSLLKSIHEFIPKLRINTEELYLVLDEAITNAMEHGNKWDPKLSINISVQLIKKNLIVKIHDEGNGFNIKKHKNLLKKRDPLSSRGRGIFIISQFCRPQWNNDGTEITLSFPLVS